MPKKQSTNTKAVEARERKAVDKKQKTEAEQKRQEDGEIEIRFCFPQNLSRKFFRKMGR